MNITTTSENTLTAIKTHEESTYCASALTINIHVDENNDKNMNNNNTTTSNVDEIIVPSHAKGMFIDEFSQKPNFILRDYPMPKITSPTHVLVHLYCTTVNPLDGKLRRGDYFRMKFPALLGKEGAGIVIGVGSKVKRFHIGSEVCGFFIKHKNGSYTNYALFDESELIMKHENMSFEQCVALPVAGRCVMEMLIKHPLIEKVIERENHSIMTINTDINSNRSNSANSSSSDSNTSNNNGSGAVSSSDNNNAVNNGSEKIKMNILVIGASGGCGSVACLIVSNYLTKFFSIQLFATCSTKNIEYVKSLGVDHVIDYTMTSASAGSETTHNTGGLSHLPSISQVIKKQFNTKYIDLVLDCVGGQYYYDDICKHMDLHLANTQPVFTTITTPSPSTEKLNVKTVLLSVSTILKHKIKSSLSKTYPNYHFILLGNTNFNVPNLELVMNHALIENDCFKKVNLVIFPLDRMNEAHLQMESGRTVGKIVITIPQTL